MNSRCCRFVLRFALRQQETFTMDENQIHAQIVTLDESEKKKLIGIKANENWEIKWMEMS